MAWRGIAQTHGALGRGAWAWRRPQAEWPQRLRRALSVGSVTARVSVCTVLSAVFKFVDLISPLRVKPEHALEGLTWQDVAVSR